jgi:hypothetical protein
MSAPVLPTAEDLDERYGGLVTLTEVTRWLGQSARAVRARLRVGGAETFQVGDEEYIPLPVLEAALGLATPRAMVGQVHARQDRQRFITRPDGTRKTVAELQSEVARGAAARRASIAG